MEDMLAKSLRTALKGAYPIRKPSPRFVAQSKKEVELSKTEAKAKRAGKAAIRRKSQLNSPR